MKVGFIGLGAMGWHMAANLADKGFLAAVYTRQRQQAEDFAAQYPVRAVTSAVQLWDDCDVICLCVPADRDVMETVEALAVPAARGRLVIDCSTVARETAIDAADLLAKVGARFLDAPITGGTEGARLARLTFMVGGTPEDYVSALPLFEAMGSRHIHIGPHGNGQATKAVNQVMAAGVAQAVTEGLAFAAALDLPLHLVIDAVSTGAAGSWFQQNRARTQVTGEYPPGLKVALHLKDLMICQQMAAQLGGDLPCVDTTLAQYQTLMAEGHGEEDISSLYRLNKRLFPQH
ncbi:NAD(P)-dependent oxidoreductase [Solimonas sp. K1W22B-7]|uniref:NAD(P)-dependent oxidoreductase n=1 Tax=Solimonas sp. K1W22B-7 TaxID=2303331 RepID=UPI000E3325DB|nr:NAD(P)-dependent oxidoreductase [Solimonas sp. K1W22B-7]AXQ31245.1 NAD(P)-dependent oxidoreductase [Solimonas sp. K1W22B-7]